MRIRTVALAVATALAVAASAVAASAAKDPSKMILLRTDFPPHSNYDSSEGEAFGWPERLTSLGVESAKAANYSGATYDSKTKTLLTITGVVVTTASAGDATKALAIVTKKNEQLWNQLPGQKFKPFSGLPLYGDQQTVTYKAPGTGETGIIHLLVRRRSVLWYLSVSLQQGPPGPPLSETLGAVKTYATKQKDKIKAG